MTAGESAPRNMDVSTSFRLLALAVVDRLEVDLADPPPLLLPRMLGIVGGGDAAPIIMSLVRPLTALALPSTLLFPPVDLGVGMPSCSTRSALRRVSVTPKGVDTGGGGPPEPELLDGDDKVLVCGGGCCD